MLTAYISELSAPEDQLVGWGVKIVQEAGIEYGHDVKHVALPPVEHTLPDVWLLSLPYAGNLHYAISFFESIGVNPDKTKRTCDTMFVIGGHAVVNPSPLLDLFDAVFVGEIDDVCDEFFAALGDLDAMGECPGVIIDPDATVEWQIATTLDRRGWYEASYDDEGTQGVGRATYLEVARGCKMGCRFCELGWAYGHKSYTERSREDVEAMIEEAVSSGVPRKQIVLSAPHTDGVSWYSDMVADGGYNPRWRSTTVYRYHRTDHAYPSGARGRIRFGVEGITPRLRTLCGKAISDDDLSAAMQKGIDEGYRMMRLFFIGGVPTETRHDRMHMQEVIRMIGALDGLRHWKSCDIKVTGLSPQPFTPWQRLGIGSAIEAIDEYRSIRSVLQHMTPQWRSVMCDKHSTDADVVKHLMPGQAISFLSHADRYRRSDIRRYAIAAGVDYAKLEAGYSADELLPWSNVIHPSAAKIARAERNWLAKSNNMQTSASTNH